MSDIVFAPDYKAGFVAAMGGCLSFSMQVYCDFAGYSIGGTRHRQNVRFSSAAELRGAICLGRHCRAVDALAHFALELAARLCVQPTRHYRKGRLRGYLNVMITSPPAALAWRRVAFWWWGAMHGAFRRERLAESPIGD